MVDDYDACGTCGVRVALAGSGSYVHTDSLPEKAELHDVEKVVKRAEYLFGQASSPQPASPAERTAAAMERIADQLERGFTVTAWSGNGPVTLSVTPIK